MKNNIAVFFGGCSDEYEVSLKSAAAVIRNINKDRYNILPIGITKKGEWFLYGGSPQNIEDNTWMKSNCLKALLSPNRSDMGIYIMNNSVWERIKIDMAFPVMHGKFGEDGSIQGSIELAGIPLIGCGTLSSALCMDKYKAHIIIKSTGINTPKSYLIEDEEDLNNARNLIKAWGKAAIKPVCSGSSLGVSIIEAENELEAALKKAFKYDEQIIIEEYIEGNEVGCAIVGNKNLIIGEVDEVELDGSTFDYNEKYNPKKSIIYIPAKATDKKRQEIKATAIKIYKALGCSGFARVDMFLTPDFEIVFNEVNTIPGFTENSRFPKMMEAAGFMMNETVQAVIDTAN